MFVLKFHAQIHKKLKTRYSICTNKGKPIRIFLTCAKVIPILLEKHPNASFGLIGARGIDEKSNTKEPVETNQRYVAYRDLIQKIFGAETFEHVDYPSQSAYLLLNRNIRDTQQARSEIERMFINTYNEINI